MRTPLFIVCLAVVASIARAEPTPAAGLTSAQRAGIQRCLKALRKLKVATEVGVTQTEMTSRLIDTKADVQEETRLLPACPVKEKLSAVVDCFQDGLKLWRELDRGLYIASLPDGEAVEILQKYGLKGLTPDLNPREYPAVVAILLSDMSVAATKRLTEAEQSADGLPVPKP